MALVDWKILIFKDFPPFGKDMGGGFRGVPYLRQEGYWIFFHVIMEHDLGHLLTTHNMGPIC